MMAWAVRVTTVGEALRILRESKGLTQAALADRAKSLGHTLGTTTIYAAEKRDQLPDHKTIMAYAAGLDVTFQDLLLNVALFVQSEDADVARARGFTPRARAIAMRYDAMSRSQQAALWQMVQALGESGEPSPS